MHFLCWRRSLIIGYFNYYAALGLRARAYLYNDQYAEALADAKEVIGKGGYKMLNRDNYVEAWTKEKADETILEFLQPKNTTRSVMLQVTTVMLVVTQRMLSTRRVTCISIL